MLGQVRRDDGPSMGLPRNLVASFARRSSLRLLVPIYGLSMRGDLGWGNSLGLARVGWTDLRRIPRPC